MSEDEFVARPRRGRIVTATHRAGLSHVRPDGRLRLDALAEFVQDVADIDAASAPLDSDGFWVLRRLTMRSLRAIAFRDSVTSSTWCSGTGRGWAERRTDLEVDGGLRAQTAALWVYVDRTTGRPTRLPAGFDAVWGETAVRTRVPARLRHDDPALATPGAAWQLRVSDLDVLGHVNNVAYWCPAEDELARRGSPRVHSAEIEFRAGVDAGDQPVVVSAETEAGFAQWWRVDGEVRASLRVGCGPSRKEPGDTA